MRNKNILIAAALGIATVLSISVTAQKRMLEIYQNGKVSHSVEVADIDSIKINSDRSGPGTVIDYAAEKFEGGGRNVPVRITRSQYSTSSFDIEFTHTYVLKDYRTR